MTPRRSSWRYVTVEEVYRRYGADLLRFLYGSHPHLNHQDCEDLLHQAVLKAVARCDQYDPERGSLRMWIFGILRNEALQDLRRRTRRSERSMEGEHVAEQPPVDAPAVSHDELLAIEEALSGLPVKEREALLVWIRTEGQASDAEVAERLGIAKGSVAVYRQRARQKLCEALRRRGTDLRGVQWLKPKRWSRRIRA